MNNDLVSIIMLSHNDSKYVERAIKCILMQTHQNWEILYIDDASTDDTLHKVMELKGHDKRFKVSQNIFERGSTASINTVLKNATGRWIAFIGGNVYWEPQKLERQMAFMKENGYAFSYTNYTKGNCVFSGKKVVTHKDMVNCCWPAFFTVMYDAQTIGHIKLNDLKENNNYALWLTISKKEVCHLLDDNLTSIQRKRERFNPFPLKGKFRWRYEVYRIVLEKNQVESLFLTYRNFVYTLVKRVYYVKRRH